MKAMQHKVSCILLALGLASLALAAEAASWAVRPDLVTAPQDVRSGATIRVKFTLARNDAGTTPTDVRFYVGHNTNSVDLLHPIENGQADMGYPIFRGLVPNYVNATSPFNNYNAYGTLDVPSEVTPPNFTLYPGCFYVNLKVKDTPKSPISVGTIGPSSGGTPAPNSTWVYCYSGFAGAYVGTAAQLVDTGTTGYTSFAVQRVISTEVLPGPIAPGGTFTVRVKVSSNDIDNVPQACALRVSYPSASVTLLDPDGGSTGDLGAVSAGPESGSGNVYRDVATAGNPLNTVVLAKCYDLTFQVNASPVLPFSIIVADQPSGTPLEKVGGGALSHIFDLDATQNINIVPVVSTELIGGNVDANQNFQIRAAVTTNDTPSTPIAGLFRVNYSKDTVEWTGTLQSGQLGSTYAGAQNTSGTIALYRNVGNLGAPGNNDKTPVCYTITFKARPYPGKPMFVTLQDPASGTPLVEKGTYASMEHVFDNAAALDLNTFFDPLPVEITYERGDGIVPGRTFRVYANVTANDWATTPGGCKFRLRYNANSVSFDSALAGELGAIDSATTGTDITSAYVDIATAGNPLASSLTPACFTALFRVATEPFLPVSISIEDPDTGTPLGVKGDLTTNIPHTFDSTDVQGMDITPLAPVELTWERADGVVPGRTVRVYANILSGGDPGSMPGICKFRLRYNAGAVTFDSATAGDLGAIASSVTGSDTGGAYVDIATAGNAANTDLTPACFTAVFLVNASPATPFSITAEDPAAGTPLGRADQFSLNIPHEFDSTDTQDLAITAPTGVQDWMMMN